VRAITLIWIVFLTACTPRAVREAESVVAQADSLRAEGRMYGIDEGDSTTLAQAYETLKKYSEVSRQFSEICPFIPCTSSLYTYAHACYHYGRLLREKDNPVEAMQVFINATHSRTHDYHILGRVYSNMGSICHLAGDYPLSYEMYEKSAQVFLQGEDTLSYYYLLNDMAFELAEQRKEQETLTQLAEIEKYCTDSDIKAKILETKAVLYLKCKQYDLALCYASYLCSMSNHYPIAKLVKAQIFSYQGIKDSAVYYAREVLRSSSNLSDIHNALYIMTNDDKSKNLSSVRETAAKRSDVQKIIEIRRSKLSQATQILEQELNRKSNFSWLYAIFATTLIIGTSISIYVTNRRKKNKLLQQKFDFLNQATEEIQEKHNALNAQYNINYKRLEKDIYHTCDMLRNSNNVTKDLSWNNFETMCEIADRNLYMFVSKLHHQKDLKETETRLCILVLIGYNRPQIAQILPYASNSVGKLKDQTAKSLGTTGKNLRNYLLKIAIEG